MNINIVYIYIFQWNVINLIQIFDLKPVLNVY